MGVKTHLRIYGKERMRAVHPGSCTVAQIMGLSNVYGSMRFKSWRFMAVTFLKTETLARIQRLMEKAGVREDDVEEAFVRGSGSGGQKINKTSSCVQLRHARSGTVVKCQKTRSREVNRWLARQELATRLIEKQAEVLSARQQASERVRRQKRRRSRRQRAKVLDDKRKQGEKKASRRSVGPETGE